MRLPMMTRRKSLFTQQVLIAQHNNTTK